MLQGSISIQITSMHKSTSAPVLFDASAAPDPSTRAARAEEIISLLRQAMTWAVEDDTFGLLSERCRRTIATAVFAGPAGASAELAAEAEFWRDRYRELSGRIGPRLAEIADPLWAAAGKSPPVLYNANATRLRDYAADLDLIAATLSHHSPDVERT